MKKVGINFEQLGKDLAEKIVLVAKELDFKVNVTGGVYIPYEIEKMDNRDLQALIDLIKGK